MQRWVLIFTACAPKELFPAQWLVDEVTKIAEENDRTVRLTEDVNEGAENADVIYIDIWVSAWVNRMRHMGYKNQAFKEVSGKCSYNGKNKSGLCFYALSAVLP